MPNYNEPGNHGEYIANLVNPQITETEQQLMLSAAPFQWVVRVPSLQERVDDMQGREIKESRARIDAELTRIKHLQNALIDTKKKMKSALLSGIDN